MTSLLVPWDEIQAEWQKREYGGLRETVSRLAGFAAQDVEALLLDRDPGGADARRVLDDAFASAGPDGEGRLALALYVYGRCLEKWEQTEDYEPIRTVVTALGEAAGPADPREELLAIVVDQAQLLDLEMDVEDAMNCSCPVAMGVRARKVVSGLTGLLGREEQLGSPATPRRIVRLDAETTKRYFQTVADVADAVLDFVDRDAPGPGPFRQVLESLDDEALADDPYESELRAHRACLAALDERADESRLRIDAAEFVYLYPFTLDVDPESAVERALGLDVVQKLADAGLGPARAYEVELNDLWERRDVPEPGYSAASVELPRIKVTTTAGEDGSQDADDVLHFTSEVRLSRLGNHHVRVVSRLGRKGAGLHDVNQALRRGSHGMGVESVESQGRKKKTWERFPSYADEVIDTVATALGAEGSVRNLDATFHVVLAATSISVQQPGGHTRPATPTDLEHAVGASLLFHPVRHLTTSLEEWIRYPPPDVTNLLEGQGYTGDLVVRTDNTTVTYMPASPEWLIDEYEEMIEFVASAPPLLTLWENKAWQLGAELDEALARLEGRIQGDDDPIGELHAQERRIRELESDIRRDLAFLHSPALCRTRAQRRFLDELWSAAGLHKHESELERRLTQLAERQERITAMAASIDALHRQKQQERAERLDKSINLLVAFLAAFGVAGVFSWLDGAFDVEAPVWAWLELAALIAIVVLIALFLLRPSIFRRRSSR